MIIKRGKIEIETVIDDSDHSLDDDGTRKALAAAEKEEKLRKSADSPLEN